LLQELLGIERILTLLSVRLLNQNTESISLNKLLTTIGQNHITMMSLLLWKSS